MAGSILQAGPMVQMIFARRVGGLSVEELAMDFGLVALNLSPQSELDEITIFLVET
jgi:hypothetical protein